MASTLSDALTSSDSSLAALCEAHAARLLECTRRLALSAPPTSLSSYPASTAIWSKDCRVGRDQAAWVALTPSEAVARGVEMLRLRNNGRRGDARGEELSWLRNAGSASGGGGGVSVISSTDGGSDMLAKLRRKVREAFRIAPSISS